MHLGLSTGHTRTARLDSYAEIGRAAFGTPGLIVVHVFHKGVLLGVTTLFLILSGLFLLEGLGGGGGGLAPRLGSPEAAAAWTTAWTRLSAGGVWVPVVSIHTLGEIAPVTLLGALASAVTVLAAVLVSLSVYPVSAASGAADGLPLSPARPSPFLY